MGGVMPLVAQATACYLAGLVIGGVANAVAGLVACLVASAVALCVSRRDLCAFAILAAAGVVVERGAADHDTRCLEVALHRSPVGGRLLGDAAPGGMVRVESARCHSEFGAFVVGGAGEMGSTITLDGTPTRGKRGWVLQRAVVTLVERPSGLDQVRASAGRAIDRAFRDDAPLARALLIADKQQLSPELRDRFARAGLAHLLAIAGLHIAVVAMVVEACLVFVGMSPTIRSAAVFAMIVTYVVMIGAPPSAVRAAAMLGARSVSRVMQRPTSPWVLLAIGGSEPLLDPTAALAIGYQLSVVCVAGLIVAADLVARAGRGIKSRLALRAVSGLVGTSLATAASAPLVAATFGRVSLVAPLSNLAAEPIFAVLQPMLFSAMSLSVAPPLASFLADAAHPLMRCLVGVAGAFAGLPAASVAVDPGLLETLLGVAAAVTTLAACASRSGAVRWAICAAACVGCLAWLPLLAADAHSIDVRFAHAGRRETVALLGPRGRQTSLNQADRCRLNGTMTFDGATVRAFRLPGASSDRPPCMAMVTAGGVRLAILGRLSESQQEDLVRSMEVASCDVVVVTRPAPDLVRRIAKSGGAVLRTDLVGSLSIRTDGKAVWIRVDSEDWIQAEHRPL